MGWQEGHGEQGGHVVHGGEQQVGEGGLGEGGWARVGLAEEAAWWASVDMAAPLLGWRFGCQPAAERTPKAGLAGQLMVVDELAAGWLASLLLLASLLASVSSSSSSHCTAHMDPSPPPRSGSTLLRTGLRGNLCWGSLAKVQMGRCIGDSSQRGRAGKGEIHLENLPLGNLAVSKPHQKLPFQQGETPPLLRILHCCNLDLPSFAHCNHPLWPNTSELMKQF